MKRYAKNEALEEIDVQQVLDDEGLDYKETWGRSGRQINVRTCPFCGNNKYKVYINQDTGLGNCFAGSCSQGTFNKWQLFKQIYDLTPRDLQRKVNQLAAQQGWRPKAVFATRFEPGDLELPKNEKIAGLYAMPKYLLNRGVTADIADYFDLRWCEQGTFTTLAPDGKQIKQDYSGRILLPIYDLHGEMVSFQGRDATGTSEKRYLFPSGFASTGEHLYNINNWADGQDTVTISEGVFDVIAVKKALSHARMDNVLPLGSFGMQFSIRPDSKDQISKLLLLKAKGLKNVVMLWDNEPAAMRNAIKTADQIRRYGFNVSVAKLSVSKDPGEASEGEIVTAINEAHAVRSNIDILMLERKLAHD